MKKSATVYIKPSEKRGLLKDIISGLGGFNYARTKAEVKDEYPYNQAGVSKYKVTVTVEKEVL